MIDITNHFCTTYATEQFTVEQALQDRQGLLAKRVELIAGRRVRNEPVDELVDQILNTSNPGSSDPLGYPVAVAIIPSGHVSRGYPSGIRCKDGSRPPSVRFAQFFSWIGPTDLFGRWPDPAPAVNVFDNDANDSYPPPVIEWQLDHNLVSTPEWIIKAYLHVGVDGEPDQAERPPADLLVEAAEHLRRYVAAVNSQIDRWRDDIRVLVTDWVTDDQRKVRLHASNATDIAQMMDDLLPPPLQLNPPPVPVPDSTITPIPATVNSDVATVVLPSLTDASIQTLVQVINRWAQAVTKWPAPYMGLDEERVSDLLASALDAAFGKTTRETLFERGKTDISVLGAPLGVSGTDAVFVIEAKNYKGPASVRAGCQQLIGQMGGTVPSGVLLILARQSLATAVSGAVQAMHDLAGDPVEPVAGRATFRVPSDRYPAGHQVTLVVVDLTATAADVPQPKGRKTPPPAARTDRQASPATRSSTPSKPRSPTET